MNASGPPNFPVPPGAVNPYSPPAAAIDTTNFETGIRNFRSALPLAKAITIVMGLDVLIELIGDINSFLTVGVMERVIRGEEVDQATLSAIDVRTGGLALLGLALLLVAAVLFCLFMPRANRNARSFGAPMSITPGWAAGYFFVPIANLWKPFQAMKEIWQGSDPDPNVHAFNVPLPALFKWWWGMYLLHNIGGQIVWRTSKTSPTPSDLITSCWVEIVTSTFSIVAALLAAAVVRAVARRQEERQRVGQRPLTGA
ncbi:MAG TPA: DUF4328 domain-containing protein [Polyangia bacterium]|nr:DUF4328 domain-containing protein [Polyangia bacterium]